MESVPIAAQTRLLKANDVRGLGSKVVFNFEDLRERGEAYLETVRQQARQLLDEAHVEVETIRKQANARGFADGQRDGLQNATETIETRAREIAEQTAREALATTLPAVRAAAEALVVERDHWLQEWEATALRLAAAMAHKIINRQLELDPHLTRETIRNALQLAVGSTQIKLRLSSEDAKRLGVNAADLIRAMAACGDVELVADGSLTNGSCVIETQHGTIDARIDALLDRIVSELLDRND